LTFDPAHIARWRGLVDAARSASQAAPSSVQKDLKIALGARESLRLPKREDAPDLVRAAMNLWVYVGQYLKGDTPGRADMQPGLKSRADDLARALADYEAPEQAKLPI